METVTDVVVVGGGPAGMIFSYMAARAGLKVTLLEAYKDFNRDFRGDTINPLAMRLLDELGLMDEILKLPHGRVTTLKGNGNVPYMLSYAKLRTKFNFVMILSQPVLLDFLARKASQFPTFDLRMQARVNGVIEENGAIKGVTYRDANGQTHEIRATLTIAADGRNSAVRKFANVEMEALTQQPDSVVWFRLPLDEKLDPAEGLVSRQDEKNSIFMFRRPYEGEWQVGLTILKTSSYKQVRADGIEAFREAMTKLLPEFKDRISQLAWQSTTYLEVYLERAKQWYREGLLLIGDAAHIMSPLGGVGINLAIRDAVVAANTLIKPLKVGTLSTTDLAKVQKKVEWDIKLTQNFQAFTQNRSRQSTGEAKEMSPFVKTMIGLSFGLPGVRDLPVRIFSYGMVPVSVDQKALAV